MKKENRISLIAIGDELLKGRRENTNSPWMAKKLSTLSLVSHKIEIVGDDEKVLEKALLEAAKEYSLVLVTGGLGPTIDDITERVARRLFGNPELLSNPVGSAKGLFFVFEESLLFFLPGPPYEMKAIFEASVLPILSKRMAPTSSLFSKNLHFFFLKETDIDPYLRGLQGKERRLQCGIYPSMGLVEVHLSLRMEKETEAKKILEDAMETLKKAFPENWIEFKETSLEEALANRLTKAGKRLCLAESMTGGAIAFRFVKSPGASQFFDGCAVVYSDEAKSTVLGVAKSLIQEKGAVSQEVAIHMAEGALLRFGSDYALSVTGLAGPTGGTPEKPIGTIYLALAVKGQETLSWHISRAFSREQLIERASIFLLGQLWFQMNREAIPYV